MGNRAVLTDKEKRVGVYIHWNGGRDSVEGYPKAARELRFRDPVDDPSYAMARLTVAIGAFLGATDSCSIGIGRLEDLDCDNYDNGVYVLGEGWKVVGRYGNGAPDQAVENPDWETTEAGGWNAEAQEKADGIAKAIVLKLKAADDAEIA